MEERRCLNIDLSDIREGLQLSLDARADNTLFDAGAEAEENNEAQFQLREGCFYDYEISDADYRLEDIGSGIIQEHRRRSNTGRIAPNIYVGTLEIPVLTKGNERCGRVRLEVQSVKLDYRSDYRRMLESITEKYTDLLLQAGAPVSHHVDVDYEKDSRTLYQRFAFVKSVIQTDEFAEAVHRIVSSPVMRWAEMNESKDVRRVRRFSNANIKELISGRNRTRLPEKHCLRNYGISTLPDRMTSFRKTDSADTPENRFVKHALKTFLNFCTQIGKAASGAKKQTAGTNRIIKESELLSRQLETMLSHALFREISRPETLRLNSPVLQRKEGYREVLRVWLMFDLAAKLIWKGGEDVYSAAKKDVAVLYEYWLFFELLDVLRDIYEISPKDLSDLTEETEDGLSLQLKQGKHTALRGVFSSESRSLNIRFNYNRSFSGQKDYPDPGSWTKTMRPDYTLSIWPKGISEREAERQELITHIHFDAKYRIRDFGHFLKHKTEEDLSTEKDEEAVGTYKDADLLKMHAYKDAIRRTGGAYILYPGEKDYQTKGFHEIVPGLGAFAVQPTKGAKGTDELKDFIREVTRHFILRSSQREKMAYRTYDIYKDSPDTGGEVSEPLPEAYLPNRGLIPDEVSVLVGYYKSSEHYSWIEDNRLYNFRMGKDNGSLPLGEKEVNAKYLLLHTKGDDSTGRLWKIAGRGPKVYSKEGLLELGYPDPGHDYYLLIELEPAEEPELVNRKWYFKEFRNFSTGHASARPYTTSLSEMMRHTAG